MSRGRARAITLQGTGSHAGKTVLVAGLCRLLARRGPRVRPAPADHRALREAAYERLADTLAAVLDARLLSDLGVS